MDRRDPGGRTARAALVAATVLATAFATTPSAAAEAEFVFIGRGFGHGLGAGQWGAKGAADEGKSHSEILRHFYTGTELASRAMPGGIRLGLRQNVSEQSFTPDGRLDFVVGGETVAQAASGQTWTVSVSADGRYRLRGPGGRDLTAGHRGTWLELRYAEHGTIVRSGSTRYSRGWMELNVTGSTLRSIIHIAPFEPYLYGLGEVPSSWPAEALKTQAVAARTYAVEKMLRLGVRSSCNCHLFADTRDQAYVGYEKEAGGSFARWKAAVDETAGVIVTDSGRPIQAFYSSSSGGHTEHNENVFGGEPIAYLRGVRDPWDDRVSPYARWKVGFDRSELSQKLGARSSTDVGSVTSIELLEPKGVSGRIVRPVNGKGGARIRGTAGTKHVSGDTLRSALGLRSTLFRLETSGLVHPNGTLLKGSGARVWLLEGGSRWPVPTATVFRSSFPWSEIVTVPDATLNRYPTARVRFREGTLLRTPDGRVWAVSNGLRRHFASASVFTSLGYSFDDVVDVSESQAAIHPLGAGIESADAHPDGALVRGSTPHVYFIDHGRKRHVPTPQVYASRFRDGQVVRASDTEIATLPPGEPLGFRDGTLVRTPNGRVWAISDGLRRHIVSASVFRAMGYSFDRVRDVTESEAALHPVGEAVDNPAVHPNGTVLKGSGASIWLLKDGTRLPILTPPVLASHYRNSDIVTVADTVLGAYATARVTFREGSLIRTPDSKVWAIANGLRRHIVSPAVFSALGYRSEHVRSVSPAEAAIHRVGPPVRSARVHPDGTVVRGDGPEIYMIETGAKRHLKSSHMVASRVPEAEIVRVSQDRLNSYPDGPDAGFRDGSLFETPDDRVWFVSDGVRRHFSSREIFTALGFSFDNVRPASATDAAVHPEGRPIG